MGATYDSSESDTRAGCLEGTRKSQLKSIMDWALGPSPQTTPIIWLKGAAGAGKTSIARTIAQLCASNHRLAASFFFKSSDPLRSKVDSVIPTLALQIAAASPTWKRVIEESLAHDPLLLEDKNKAKQFSTLIHRPLHMTHSEGHMTPLVIVVDALDECDDYVRLHALLRAMTNSLVQQPSPIRLLLTSRPERPIISFFRGVSSPIYEEIELKPDEEANEDILRYLHHEFSRIRIIHEDILHGIGEWPLPDDISWIARKASGHFIYAATIIRFIDDDWENPADALDYIRGRLPSSNHNLRPLYELDDLYLAILRRAEARGNRTNLLQFLVLYSSRGSSLRYHDDLSERDVIARALNVTREGVILLHRNLRSLIGPVGKPFDRIVGFLHLSFDDFLLDPRRAQEFFIGEKAYALDFGHSFWCASFL